MFSRESSLATTPCHVFSTRVGLAYPAPRTDFNSLLLCTTDKTSNFRILLIIASHWLYVSSLVGIFSLSPSSSILHLHRFFQMSTPRYRAQSRACPWECHVMFVSVTSSILVGIALAEAILFLRVWAISGRDRTLSIYLIIHFTAVHLVQAVLFGLFIGSLEFGPSPSPLPGIIGCFPLPPKSKTLNTLLSALFGLIVANELSILFITFVIGLRKFRDFRNPLIRVFYVDGFSYFLVLSAISTTNVVVDLVGPPEYRFLGLVVLQRVMHSILSTRMILHLRGAANDGTKPPTSNVQTGNSGEASRPLSVYLGRQSPIAVSTDLTRTVKRTASPFPGTLLEDIELSERSNQLRKTDPEEPLCVPL